MLPGGHARVRATDPSGRYIVGFRLAGEKSTVVLWTDGERRDLAVDGSPVAVNANGVIVGYSGSDDTSSAWIYRDGHATPLPKPTGYGGTMVLGVNTRGDAVGYAMQGALDRNVPVYWPADQPGTVRKLTVPSNLGDHSMSAMRASGINDDRTIVGWARGVPVRWTPDGAPHALPLPGGYTMGTPQHVRGRYAYGNAGRIGDGRLPVVRWDLVAGTATVVVDGVFQVADGTPTGQTLAGDLESADELIEPDGTRMRLPEPEETIMAWSISDDGKTIVGSAGPEGDTPVIWRC